MSPQDQGQTGSESATAVDPVCGMTVAKASAQHVATYNGKTYYFCSGSCRATFLADPAKWAKAAR